MQVITPQTALKFHFNALHLAVINNNGERNMTNTQVWLITGAGRGMGLYIAKAALTAGHNVVATGRNTDKVSNRALKSGCFFIRAIFCDFDF
jgi:hypothetical protein